MSERFRCKEFPPDPHCDSIWHHQVHVSPIRARLAIWVRFYPLVWLLQKTVTGKVTIDYRNHTKGKENGYMLSPAHIYHFHLRCLPSCTLFIICLFQCIELLNKAGGSFFLKLLNSELSNQVVAAQSLIQTILNSIVEMDLKNETNADPKLLKGFERRFNCSTRVKVESFVTVFACAFQNTKTRSTS